MMPTLDWKLHECLKKCTPRAPDTPKAQNINLKKLRKQDITFYDVVRAYKFIANIVTIYGDKYLPIFERLHNEVIKQKSNNELLDIAKNITQKKLSTDNKSEKKVKNISHIFSHVSHTNYFS